MGANTIHRRNTGKLIDRLPTVRGNYRTNAPLSTTTWFRVGGPAEVLYRPADSADLAVFLAGKPADVPVTILGLGSNLLVRDGGIPGVTIRLGKGFAEIKIQGTDLEVGAAAMDSHVAIACKEAEIAGLEFLSGIPGSIGGALRMNAGAYGSEIADVTLSVDAVDTHGIRHTLEQKDIGFLYRHCGVPEDWIFTGARLRGHAGEREAITKLIDQIKTARNGSQPIRSRTGGSTFRNPPTGPKAWELIDRAGCRGQTLGGAQVSEQHCNFIINTGTATAADIETLGEDVRKRVLETSGVDLHWEIRRVGVPAREEETV